VCCYSSRIRKCLVRDFRARKKQIHCECTDAVNSSIIWYPCSPSHADALAGSYKVHLVELAWSFCGESKIMLRSVERVAVRRWRGGRRLLFQGWVSRVLRGVFLSHCLCKSDLRLRGRGESGRQGRTVASFADRRESMNWYRPVWLCWTILCRIALIDALVDTNASFSVRTPF
jgi:hypothetical protein